MSQPPIDMLKKCRDQFGKYAGEHRAKATDPINSAKVQNAALNKALTNEQFVAEINATLRAWE